MSTRTIAAINHIEIREIGPKHEKVAYIAGTPLTVAEVAHMHLYQDSDVEWILENFDGLSLTAAKIYAALSYYLDHQAELDDYLRRQSEAARAQATRSLTEEIARLRAKTQRP
ncbi:MAG: DUF433 domain-containing protein [Anaerolineae bacterium]|nr:DUF433 domain-containing protein [Anaerolineae bacterium]